MRHAGLWGPLSSNSYRSGTATAGSPRRRPSRIVASRRPHAVHRRAGAAVARDGAFASADPRTPHRHLPRSAARRYGLRVAAVAGFGHANLCGHSADRGSLCWGRCADENSPGHLAAAQAVRAESRGKAEDTGLKGFGFLHSSASAPPTAIFKSTPPSDIRLIGERLAGRASLLAPASVVACHSRVATIRRSCQLPYDPSLPPLFIGPVRRSIRKSRGSGRLR